jgi:hypothetical protein
MALPHQDFLRLGKIRPEGLLLNYYLLMGRYFPGNPEVVPATNHRQDLPENLVLLEKVRDRSGSLLEKDPRFLPDLLHRRGLRSHLFQDLRRHRRMNCQTPLLRNPRKKSCQKIRYLVKNP